MNPFEHNAVKALTQLLKLTDIKITKKTLTGKLQKHPNFPSLASIKDVLTECKIKTVAARGSIEKIAVMPMPSLVFLTIEGGFFAAVRKVSDGQIEWYHTQKGWQNDTLYEFEQKWSGAILLIEPTTEANERNYIQKYLQEQLEYALLPFILTAFISFIGLIIWFNYPDTSRSQIWQASFLMLVKMAGAVLSGLLIWRSIKPSKPVIRPVSYLLHPKKKNSNLLNSGGAYLFSWLSWAELGAIYFTGGVLGFLVALIFNENIGSLFFLLSLLPLPFTVYLFYDQVFRVKEWCLICLMVLVLFWIDFFINYYFTGGFSALDGIQGYSLLGSYLFIISVYVFIKPFLSSKNEGQDLRRELKKMKFNPDYMEGFLKAKNQLPPVFENMKIIGIGDQAAKHTITLVYSPGNPESAKMHSEVYELSQNRSDLYWQIIFLPLNQTDVQVIQTILNYPDEIALKGLHKWFLNIEQPVEKWKQSLGNGLGLSDDEIKEQVSFHSNWCNLARITSIPGIFVDGKQVPAAYQVSEIPVLCKSQKDERINIQSSTQQYLQNSEITVIMNIWKRDHVKEQLLALFNQTLKPSEIWIVQYGDHVSLDEIKKQYPFLKVLSSTMNLKYFGRFSFAQYAKSKYIYILDDDVIPSKHWLQECKSLCEARNAIISSAGRIIPENDFYPEKLSNVHSYFIGDVRRDVPYNYCESETKVDFGCNSWFFKAEWLKDFWRLNPHSLETGEDIHFSAVCKIGSGTPTIVPAQINEVLNGNLKKWYGHDDIASWKQSDFLPQRADVLKNMIEKNGWKPLLWS